MYTRDPLQSGLEPSKVIKPILDKLGIFKCRHCQELATTIVNLEYGLCEDHYQEEIKNLKVEFVKNPFYE